MVTYGTLLLVEDKPLLGIRGPLPSDYSFLHSCFYNGQKREANRRGVAYVDLAAECKRLVDSFLRGDGDVGIHIATPADDTNLIAGVSIASGRDLIWIYVRLSLRGFGVEEALVRAAVPEPGEVRVLFNDRFTVNRLRHYGYQAKWDPVYGR